MYIKAPQFQSLKLVLEQRSRQIVASAGLESVLSSKAWNILGMQNISCLCWVTWQQVTKPKRRLGRWFLNRDLHL